MALCCWNGEQFIDEQLESLVRQTRLPDELIICDDASSDSTIGKLQEGAVTGSEQYAAWATELELVATHLCKLGTARTHMKGIDDRATHLRVRAGLPVSRIRRIGAIAHELRNNNYHRFSNGYVSLLKDLLRRI